MQETHTINLCILHVCFLSLWMVFILYANCIPTAPCNQCSTKFNTCAAIHACNKHCSPLHATVDLRCIDLRFHYTPSLIINLQLNWCSRYMHKHGLVHACTWHMLRDNLAAYCLTQGHPWPHQLHSKIKGKPSHEHHRLHQRLPTSRVWAF